MATPLRLLLVEDDPDDAELLVHQLRREDLAFSWHRVDTAADYLVALAEGPDVILADYTLPQFSALEALDLLKQSGREAPLIVVSGSIGEERAAATMRAGAVDYVLKDRPGRLGKAIHAALAARDLRRAADQAETARRAAEAARRRAEERFTLAFTASPIAIAVIGVADGCFHEVNTRFVELTGYRREQLLGRAPAELGLWAQPEELERAGQLVVRFGSARDIEVALRTRTSEIREVSLALARLEFADGPGLLLMAQDISGRKQAEAEAARLLAEAQAARDEAEAASRAKDVLLSTVSHELRTPLTPLLAYTQLLQAGRLSAENSATALATIQHAGEALRRLIEDLLDVSRSVGGTLAIERHPVGLASVVDNAIALLRPTAEAQGVTLLWPDASAPVEVVGDAVRLQQVVWNLVGNALKVTPAGGQITVGLHADGKQVRLTVTDTGNGIRADLLPHIFEPFRQGTNPAGERYGGLGLGLAVVRHLVQAHGGKFPR